MWEWFPNLPEEELRRILASLGSMWGAPDPEHNVNKPVHKKRCQSCGQFLSRRGAYAWVSNHGNCHLKAKCLEKAFTKLNDKQLEAFYKKEEEKE